MNNIVFEIKKIEDEFFVCCENDKFKCFNKCFTDFSSAIAYVQTLNQDLNKQNYQITN